MGYRPFSDSADEVPHLLNDNYSYNRICWVWRVGFIHLGHSFCNMVDTKMSKIANTTSCVVAFIVGLVLMYGHGYKSGKNAQMTMESAIEIAKNQFKCEMTRR